MSCLLSLPGWDDIPHKGLAQTGSDNSSGLVLVPWDSTGISCSFCDICTKSKEPVSCERATSLLRSLNPPLCFSRPSELPTASHRTALLVGSSSCPEPGWMTYRRPPPLRPASAAQLPASPKWSCACLAKLCWTETRWISQTPVSYSWYRPTDSGQRWAPPLFFLQSDKCH